MSPNKVFPRLGTMLVSASLVVGFVTMVAIAQESGVPSQRESDESQFSLLKELDRRAVEAINHAEMPDDPKRAHQAAGDLTRKVVMQYVTGKQYDRAIVLKELGHEPFPDRYLHLRDDFIFGVLRTKDVESLTDVLAVNCPANRMGLGESIESALALYPADSTQGKGVHVLCDAYAIAKSKENRKRLATALRRGMEPLGITAEDDDQFVAMAAKWLDEHKATHKANPDYRLKAGGPLSFRTDIPLFVPIGSVNKWHGKTVKPPL